MKRIVIVIALFFATSVQAETVENLRIIVKDLRTKTTNLQRKVTSLNSFLSQIDAMISERNPFAETVDIDELIAAQLPVYQQHLIAIEAAADTLGTDR